jgi:hypothetical protein
LILSLIPTPADLLDLAAVWASGLVLLLWGRVLMLGRGLIEMQTIAGWGGLALVLTLWGVFRAEPLWWPAAAIAAVAVVVLFVGDLRPRREDWTALLRIMVLALPIWAIMLTARPSQPDTFLNLLPNAAYLYDYGVLPTDARPPSHSFLPGAPYNLQFWAYLAGAALPQFPASAMVHVNVLLHLLVGLLLARVVQSLGREGAGAPGWGACGLGILLATGLNPGFVPRIYFAAYGEASVAACLAVAGWLAAQSLGAMAEGARPGRRLWALALVLAALVNIKQESVAFVAGLGITIAVLGLFDPQIRFSRTLRFLPAFLPAAGLYLVWRWFVLSEFSLGELKPLPVEQWNWDILPQTLSRIGVIVIEKGVFFAFLLLALVLLVVRIRRRGLDLPARLLALLLGTCALYDVFLLFAYVAHFSPKMSADAHSFFRYNTHLSLLLVLALTTVVRAEFEERGWAPSWGRRRLAAGFFVLASLAVPIAFAQRLRFDLVMPQPLVRALGHDLAALLQPDDKLALVLPGDDNNSVAVMLESVLRYEAPRVPRVELTVFNRFDDGTLSTLEGQGIGKAVVSCAPEGGALPAHRALLLARTGEGWTPLAVWRYPEPDGRRWTAMLSASALCR